MTQEQKAERYDEALEKIKGLLKDQEIALHAREKLANVFPELKENENERIRKELIDFIKHESYMYGIKTWCHGYTTEEIISWLEKQGEKDKLIQKLGESEDEKIRKDCMKYLDWEYQHCPLNEDKMKIEKCVAWLEKQKEKQSIWTNSDRAMTFTLLRDVDQMTYISKEGKNERLQWLNSLEGKFNSGE